MDQRISLITLGVSDMAASAAFYEALGWARVDSPDGVVAFDLIGQVLGLYPLADLERDLGQARTPGFSGVTLGHNLPDKADVAALTEKARAAGATVIKEPHDIFWGGHIAYVADPDGHIWEFAWNPHSPLGPNREFRWNGYAA
ncbi:MAG: VOC family protein [Rhodobacteraceae bacterium]|nr:VOC family protein [Paracoccaceae bacterium]